MCSPGNNSKQAVVNVVTGESYRSIMAWAREIGHLKSYQRLRIALINKGCITVDGVEYSMPSFKQKDRKNEAVVVDVLVPVASGMIRGD